MLYNLFYNCMCRADDRCYTPKENRSLGDYANLNSMLNCWLKGQDREQNDGGVSDIYSGTIYYHPKLLPHYLHCLRYIMDKDQILNFLLEFKVSITEDTSALLQAESTRKESRSLSHQILLYQCLLKELFLMYLRFQSDEGSRSPWSSLVVLRPIVEDLLSQLLFNDVDNDSFRDNVNYLTVFVIDTCSQQLAIDFLCSLITNLFTRIVNITSTPNPTRLSNFAFLIRYSSEVLNNSDVTYALFQKLIRSNLQQPRTSHFLSSADNDTKRILPDSSPEVLLRKSSSDASSLKQTISTIDEFSTNSPGNVNVSAEDGKENVPLPPSLDDEVDIQSTGDAQTVSSDTSDRSLSNLSQDVHKISLAERVPWRDTVEKIRMSFLCNGKSYFDVVACLIPFAETIAKAPLISISGFHLHELLLFAFFQECYRMYNMSNSYLQLNDRIQRILSLQRIITVLLKSCRQNFDLFTRLVCTYVVTLRECYRSVDSSNEEGELLINLLQSEIIHISDSLYVYPTLSSLFFVPHNTDYIPIPLLALGFLSQFSPKVLELTLECTDVIHLVSSAAQYAYTTLFNDSFSMISNRPKLLLAITGAKYMDSLSAFRIKCQSIVSAQQLSFHQILDDFHSLCRNREQFWQFYCQNYRAIGLHSKEQFLRHCTYYVLDPHMDSSGVRRKMMRVYPPKHAYENARVHKEEGVHTDANGERDMTADSWTFDEITGKCRSCIRRNGSASCTNTFVLADSIHRRSQVNKSKELRELPCLSISTYDLTWGMVTMQEGRLVFVATAKPESIKGRFPLEE